MFPVLILVGFFVTSGCGGLEHVHVETSFPEYEPVQFPTAQQIELGLADPNSLILAVPMPQQENYLYPSGNFAYLSESFHEYFQNEFVNYLAPGYKSVYFISYYDINHQEFLESSKPPLAHQPFIRSLPLKKHPVGFAHVLFEGMDVAKTAVLGWLKRHKISLVVPNWINKFLVEPKKTFKKNQDTYSSLLSHHYWYGSGSQVFSQGVNLLGGYEQLGMMAMKDPGSFQYEQYPPVIVVFDSGTDIQHPYLKARLWENPYEGQAGCERDQYGCNTAELKIDSLGDGRIYPYKTTGGAQACPKNAAGYTDSTCSHGTHVAGIIASDADIENNLAPGICAFCKIFTIRIIREGSASEPGGGAPDSAILKGLKYISLLNKVLKKNEKILIGNISLGKYQKSKVIELMIKANRKQGFVLFAATGNEDSARYFYPAAYTEVVAVNALDQDNEKAPYSNYGLWTNISAPGHEIIAPIPYNGSGDKLGKKSGTSMAAPMVAGVAGMLRVAYPYITTEELVDRIVGKTNIGALYREGSMNRTYFYSEEAPLLGLGKVDLGKAMDLSPVPRKDLRDKLFNRLPTGCVTVQKVTTSSSWIWLGFFLVLPFLQNYLRRGFNLLLKFLRLRLNK